MNYIEIPIALTELSSGLGLMAWSAVLQVGINGPRLINEANYLYNPAPTQRLDTLS